MFPRLYSLSNWYKIPVNPKICKCNRSTCGIRFLLRLVRDSSTAKCLPRGAVHFLCAPFSMRISFSIDMV